MAGRGRARWRPRGERNEEVVEGATNENGKRTAPEPKADAQSPQKKGRSDDEREVADRKEDDERAKDEEQQGRKRSALANTDDIV